MRRILRNLIRWARAIYIGLATTEAELLASDEPVILELPDLDQTLPRAA